MNKNLYVEIHALQDLPPNCLNRDENGSPKTALYGGRERSYVSSQAWKKAIREYFKRYIDEDKIGYRTLELVNLVQKDLIERHGKSEKEAKALTKNLLKSLGLKADKEKTKAILAVSKAEVRALADELLKDPNNADELKKALKYFPSVDVCLFGRMAADDKKLNVDAACQIAPAISVNEIQMDTDFFTAVDEVKETTGAGMMGTKEFTSGVMYRYADLSVNALKENTEDNIPRLVSNFVRSFVESMPAGMQNGFAAQTIPYALYVTIREDRPISFVSAFEAPVEEKGEGYRKEAAERFKKEVYHIYDEWAEKPAHEFTVGHEFSDLAPSLRLGDLYSTLETVLSEREGL